MPTSFDTDADLLRASRLSQAATSLTIGPAAGTAPVAVNDRYSLLEDGAPNQPWRYTKGVVLNVLSNDQPGTKITSVTQPLHGSVTIVDGADADLLPGDALLYIPHANYSGTELFSYRVTSLNAGNPIQSNPASVQISIAPVADQPDLRHEILPGERADTMVLRLTAAVRDTDGSESITDLDLFQTDGVEIVGVSSPAYQPPGLLVRDFVLALDPRDGAGLQLEAFAVARESLASAQPAHTRLAIPVDIERAVQWQHVELHADAQSMWGPDGALHDEHAFSLQKTWNVDVTGDVLHVATEGTLAAALTSSLHAADGQVEATLPFDVGVLTVFNRSNDVLQITAAAELTGGSFQTRLDSLDYRLDLVYDLLMQASVHSVADGQQLAGAALEQHVDAAVIDVSAAGLASAGAHGAGLDVTFQQPQLLTDSWRETDELFGASGAADSLLWGEVDLDALAAALLGQDDMLRQWVEVDGIGTPLDLADADTQVWTALRQAFAMEYKGLSARLTLEDGTEQAFSLGTELVIANASRHDADGDGHIGFSLHLTPEVGFTNRTELGHAFSNSFELMKHASDLDWGIPAMADAPYSAGPDWTTVFDTTFELDFVGQTLNFVA